LMNVAAWSIADDPNSPMGPSATAFTETGTTYDGTTETGAFTMLQAPSNAARIGLQFTPDPTMKNGIRTAILTITTTSGDHIVYLVAHVNHIFPATLDTLLDGTPKPLQFGTLMVCSDTVIHMAISNERNEVAVTVTDADISGASASEFVLATRVPLVLPAHGSSTIDIHFLPSSKGVKQAQLTL